MAVQTIPLTIDEFLEIAQQPQYETCQLELHDGVIEEMPPSSYLNSMIAAQFVRLLGNYVYDNGLGTVTGADGGYRLGPRTVVIPDAAFISRERKPDTSAKIIEGAPDLAVEVISPSESHPKVIRKVRRYLLAGTKLVLAVYADDEVINVYRLLESGELGVQTLGIEDTFEGGDAVPGFQLALRSIFPKQEEAGSPNT
jgi:Uma2 family endonuclease